MLRTIGGHAVNTANLARRSKRRTGNRIRVRAEDGQTFRSYCPHHHALATHRVVEDLSRVTEENRTAGHEESAVVQPNENDSSNTGPLIFGLGVLGSTYSKTDVGEEDGKPCTQELRSTLDALGEPKTKQGHKESELERK